MEQDWSKKLKQRMESHEMAAPEALWQRIESNLASAQVAKNKHRGAVVWMRRAAAAAAVTALVATAAWFALQSPQLPSATNLMAEHNDANHDDQMPEIKPTIVPEDQADEASIEKVQRLTVASATPRAILAAETPDTAAVAPQSESVDMAVTDLPPATRASNDQPAAKKQAEQPRQHTVTASADDANGNTLWQDIKINKPRKNRWSTGLYASSSTGEQASKGQAVLLDAANSFTGVQSSLPLQTLKRDPKLTHNLPGEVGVRVKYDVTDRIFVEGGVGYAYLSSDYANDVIKLKQTLHYVGVPVNVGYTFWRRGIFAAYASAGVKGEKLVSGKRKTEYLSGEPVVEKQSISEKQLQWSIGGAVGVEMKLVDHVSLFAEPGVVHHFDNGSDVENVYKERPTDFSLRVGLRLTK